jgi:hypothetical protein
MRIDGQRSHCRLVSRSSNWKGIPMKRLRVVAIGLIAASFAEPSRADDPQRLERWDQAVCLVTESTDSEGKPSIESGSGFVISVGEEFVLVTAGHGMEKMLARTKMFHRRPDGESRWIELRAFMNGSGNPWTRSRTSDVAVMRLETARLKPIDRESLQWLAIPFESIAEQTPRRTAPIEVVGFPMTLGLRPEVSPIVSAGTIASRETPAETSWGTEPIVFALPAMGAGSSGGPVFLAREDPNDVQVVGMCVGIVFDKSGAKYSKLVPARALRESVIELTATPPEKPVSLE